MKNKLILSLLSASLVFGVFGASVSASAQENEGTSATVNNEAYQEETFSVETAITYAENFLDNDALVFSSNGELHKDSDGNVFYQLRAQNKEWVDGGGSGTVGFYDVYPSGKIVEQAKPIN